MTIFHKAGFINKSAYVLRKLSLANTSDNPGYVPLEAEPQIPIQGTNITDIGTKFFEQCILIPALWLAYNTSAHSYAGQTPAMLEKGCNPRLPADTLRKDFIYIHPTASRFELIFEKVKHNANKGINEAFEYENRSGTKVIKSQT
ncbi:hypothetical protein O181_062594 [Austropuccinia psidii MF-1]|uniref:Uncharacterized protein n=1 Tax=Austropuccinia psidii MF-1 TaxID=1389203 RepID=A0A9Q3I1Q0_9BASI|nr:hypothetical protein [Austropuccinia psidii MF-1]